MEFILFANSFSFRHSSSPKKFDSVLILIEDINEFHRMAPVLASVLMAKKYIFLLLISLDICVILYVCFFLSLLFFLSLTKSETLIIFHGSFRWSCCNHSHPFSRCSSKQGNPQRKYDNQHFWGTHTHTERRLKYSVKYF